MTNHLTKAQIWADAVTTFSGSWPFIIWFTILGTIWVVLNISGVHSLMFDPYPFLFLNWVMTVVSTLQSPLIMLSQNRQNERDRENIELQNETDRANMVLILSKMDEILQRLNTLESK